MTYLRLAPLVVLAAFGLPACGGPPRTAGSSSPQHVSVVITDVRDGRRLEAMSWTREPDGKPLHFIFNATGSRQVDDENRFIAEIDGLSGSGMIAMKITQVPTNEALREHVELEMLDRVLLRDLQTGAGGESAQQRARRESKAADLRAAEDARQTHGHAVVTSGRSRGELQAQLSTWRLDVRISPSP